MQRLTKKYPNGNITIDTSNFTTHQEVIDSEIQCSEPIKAAVERLYEYENAEKHGQWTINENKFAVCSKCQGSYYQEPHGIYLYNYCPHCGTKMGESENAVESTRTNYDRIKNMSIEEMGAFLYSVTDCHSCPARRRCADRDWSDLRTCTSTLLEWLESEAEE
ncbi:MAG: hypothetical protein J1F01_05570 [Oscillospiraceae bacterium]|nr:hypothetical protein [Oscillospiraceae bacterium]